MPVTLPNQNSDFIQRLLAQLDMRDMSQPLTNGAGHLIGTGTSPGLTGSTTVPTPTTPTTPTTTTPTADEAARSAAIARAQLSFDQEAYRRGLDGSQYQPQFQSYIDRILGGMAPGEGTARYDAAFSPNVGSDFLNDVQSNARANYSNQAASTFNPSFAQDRVGTSILDQTITDLLSREQSRATGTLDRGLARGQLNQRGYDAGISALGNQRTAQEARIRTLGGDVLSQYRQGLNDIGTQARNAASGYTLGGNFDLNNYLSQADNLVNQAQTQAPGRLLETIGTSPLFDLATARQNAGQAQGAINLRNIDVNEALARRAAANSVGRGLGSQGAF